MNHLTNLLVKIGILKKDLDYHLIRASMVIIFLFFGGLLLLGFWNKKLGILGALGACFSFIATFTIIPFMPNGWAVSAGGFPAMTEKVAFLMKDLVLFAASFYLLRQDVAKRLVSTDHLQDGVQPEHFPPLHVKRAN